MKKNSGHMSGRQNFLNSVTDIDNANERERELSNCSFVKAILMLLVVFYHSILLWQGNWFNQSPVYSFGIWKWLSQWLNTFHIYGFALVSGYIFYYLKHEQGKYGAFLPFLKNKAKRLLVPYVFVAAIWVVPVACLFFQYDWHTVVQKYVLATSPNQLWFLWMLFDVFVVFWVLADFFRKHNFLSFIVAGTFWVIGFAGSALFPNVFMIWTALQYIPFFWLGFKLRQHGTQWLRKIPAIVYLLIDVLAFVVTQKMSAYDTALTKMLYIAAKFATNVIGALVAFVVLQRIANRVNWNNGFFKFIIKRSMIIYLFHQQVIYFFIDSLNGRINPLVHGMVNFAGAMIISCLIASVCFRFKATRFLVGEK